MFDKIKIENEDGKLTTKATMNGKEYTESFIPFDSLTPENLDSSAYLHGGQIVSSMEAMLLLKRIAEVEDQVRFDRLMKRLIGDKAPQGPVENPLDLFALLQSKMADREALSWAISEEYPEEYKAHVQAINGIDLEDDLKAADFDLDKFYPNETRQKGEYDLKVMKQFHEEFPDVVQGNSFVDTLKKAGATLGKIISSPNTKMALGSLSLATAVVAGGPFAAIVGPLAFANAAVQHPSVSAFADKITDKFVNTMESWGVIKPETAVKLHNLKDSAADKMRAASDSRSMRWVMTGLAIGGVLLGAANVDSITEMAKSTWSMIQDGSAADLVASTGSSIAEGASNAIDTVSSMSFGEMGEALVDGTKTAVNIAADAYDESLNVAAEGMANTYSSVSEFASTTANDLGNLADGMSNAVGELGDATKEFVFGAPTDEVANLGSSKIAEVANDAFTANISEVAANADKASAAATKAAGVANASNAATAVKEATEVTTQVASDVSNAAEHVVQKGESLWKITKDMMGPGATDTEIANYVNKLAEVNKLSNPDLILPNQTLIMPEMSAVTAPVADAAKAVEDVIRVSEQTNASSVFVKGVDGSVLKDVHGNPILNANSVDRIVDQIADKDAALAALIDQNPEGMVHIAAQAIAKETVTIGNAASYTAETVIKSMDDPQLVQEPEVRDQIKRAMDFILKRDTGQSLDV